MCQWNLDVTRTHQGCVVHIYKYWRLTFSGKNLSKLDNLHLCYLSGGLHGLSSADAGKSLLREGCPMPMAYPPSAARHRTALKVLHFHQIGDRCLIVVSTFSKNCSSLCILCCRGEYSPAANFLNLLTGFSFSPPGHLLKTPLSCPWSTDQCNLTQWKNVGQMVRG